MPGATVVGLTYKDGVLLCGEKRIAYGTYIVSRSGKKVFKITNSVGAAFAGMVADMQILVREVSSYVKIREMELRRPLPPNSVAKLMSVFMFERRYFPYLTQVVIGGINGTPSIYVLDPLGSVIPDEYAAVGSGAETAIGVVETGFTPGLTEKAAKELATKALRAAIQRDAASGDGIDFLTISSKGQNEESIKF
ncbi:MAG: proteasome subunit beta [Thaumarchaeota archaeon]|jgi:proteasome beta subunit|nr:proteasome subunit beta [Nitrososphaerota archaeon]